MFLDDPKTNSLGSIQNGSIRNRTTNRSSQGDHRGHIVWPIPGHRTGDNPAKAVPDKMDLASGTQPGLFDGQVQPALDEQVRTICVDSDAGKVGTVSDALQPSVKFGEVKIGAEKTGMMMTAEPSPRWNAQAVVHGSRVQQKDLGREYASVQTLEVLASG